MVPPCSVPLRFMHQVLDVRPDRLAEEARGLLAVAAVIGRMPPPALWATVSGVDEEARNDRNGTDRRAYGCSMPR
jgi:hypothetical protein